MADVCDKVGKRVLQYDVLAELGRGGFGRVYAATDRNTGQRVALKFLETATAEAPSRAELVREASAVARLSHRGIVALYGLHECEGESFLVEEFVEGESLASRLERGPVDGVELVRLASEVTAALAHAHGRGVLHRDIKPANILIAADGTYKLTDFGLARIEGMTPSASGRFRGTLPYTAPERVRGHRGDARADLFSLGAVLYEAMTGQRAFGGDTEAQIVYAVLSETPRPIDCRNRESRLLAEVVERLLDKEPGGRPSTALAVAELISLGNARSAKASRRWMRVAVPIVSILAIAVAVVCYRLFSRHSHEGPVVILRFRNVVDPADSARLGLITSTLLVSRLASASSSGVLNAESVIEAMGGIEGVNPGDTRRLARRTHAAWIVTGNILRTNPTVLLTAQLSDAASDRIVDAVRVETQPGQTVYDAADMLAERLVSRLPALSAEKSRGLRLSRDFEADRYYVDGLEYFSRGELEEARTRFSLAVGRDPEFAAARSALGRTLWLLTPGADRLEP